MTTPERYSRPSAAALTLGWVLLVTILTLAVVAVLVARAGLKMLAAPLRRPVTTVAQMP